MSILEFLVFLLSIFPIVLSMNTCSSSSCGNYYFPIDYPFKLQGQETGNNCTYTSLICNDQGILAINLPFSGDFYVSYINYYTQRIQLYDPSNCLPKRLMNSVNLSSSPFLAEYYDNYTFYTCPVDADPVGYDVVRIGCLSNSTNSTVATSLAVKDELEYFGCKIISSSMFPVFYHGQFNYDGIYGNLELAWNVPDCKECEKALSPDKGGSPGKGWYKFIESPFFVVSFLVLVMLLSACCALLIKMTAGRNGTSATTALPQSAILITELPLQTTAGLDDSKIKSYTEMVVVDENQSSSPGNGTGSCAICLEAYLSQEEATCIAKCGHFFHTHCIHQWLRKNGTCPVCRTSLSDAKM